MRSPHLLLAALLLAAGCATTSSATGSHRLDPQAPPSAYYPLAEGTAWSYDVVDANGDSLLLINRVERRDGNKITIRSGNDTQLLEDRGTAIVRLPSGDTVLQGPFAVGTSWAVSGGTARLVEVDAVVESKLGPHRGCVVVVEESPTQRTVTSFAPGIGPVKIEVYSREGTEVLAFRGLLRGFRAAGAEGP